MDSKVLGMADSVPEIKAVMNPTVKKPLDTETIAVFLQQTLLCDAFARYSLTRNCFHNDVVEIRGYFGEKFLSWVENSHAKRSFSSALLYISLLSSCLPDSFVVGGRHFLGIMGIFLPYL